MENSLEAASSLKRISSFKSSLLQRLSPLFQQPFLSSQTEKQKCFYLGLIFFLLVGAYTLVKELQGSLFSKIVGIEYVPIAKTFTIIVLFPAIILYGMLVDRLKRYQLLLVYTLAFTGLGLLFTYLLGNPDFGLDNTEPHVSRVFGWIIYFYIEGFNPYIVGVFWAFSNSVNQPQEAQRTYSLIVASSKVGGMVVCLFAYQLMSEATFFNISVTTTEKQQLLMLVSTLMLGCVPVVLLTMVRRLDMKSLGGYQNTTPKGAEKPKSKTGVWSGLRLLLQQPYVLGIFGLVFFFEVVNQVLNYQRLILAETNSQEICGMNAILYKQMFFVHFSGFFLALFGTTFFMRVLGTGKSILLMPVLSFVFIGSFIISGSVDALVLAYIALHSLSYTIAIPVRESLYILTVKDIQFKSKSWIDSFGMKLAKSLGQQFNLATSVVRSVYGMGTYTAVNNIFFIIVLTAWLITAYLLSQRYERALRNKELIG